MQAIWTSVHCKLHISLSNRCQCVLILRWLVAVGFILATTSSDFHLNLHLNYYRCRTDVARVERIPCEQGLFISPATLQGFKSEFLLPLRIRARPCTLHLLHKCLQYDTTFVSITIVPCDGHNSRFVLWKLFVCMAGQ